MVGPVAKIDGATLPRRSNIEWLGQQSFDSLPRMAAYWDACLMPFATNEATRCISPTKTLEYMAAGKPIVSTNVRDVADCFGDIVRVALGPAEFVKACDAALAESHGDARHGVKPCRTSPPTCLGRAVSSMELAVFGSRRRAVEANYENVIIGAGPAGLAAALGLSRDTLLVEREDRIGGLCRSIKINGYTFDHAGHVMASQDAYVLALYERLSGERTGKPRGMITAAARTRVRPTRRTPVSVIRCAADSSRSWMDSCRCCRVNCAPGPRWRPSTDQRAASHCRPVRPSATRTWSAPRPCQVSCVCLAKSPPRECARRLTRCVLFQHTV
jgi:hypothetical protein